MKTLTSNWTTAALVVGALLAGASGQAANVINPVGIELKTGADAFFPAFQMIDGSGLEFQLNTGQTLPASWRHNFGNPSGESWVSGAFGFPSDWFAASGTIPTFVLDLGQQLLLDAVHLWAYSGGTGFADCYQGNSAKIIEFRFNTAAQGDASFVGPAITVTLNHGPLDREGTGFIIPRQDFAVGAQDARYVEMRIMDNWFEPPGNATGGDVARGGDRVGLGELRFSVIPEPSSYLLFLSGLLVLGLVWARRPKA